MKKSIRFASILAILSVLITMGSCGSSNSADEPDMPVTDTIPEPNVSGSEDEDDFVPYTGEIEPLSEELRPFLTEGKKWIVEYYYAPENDNWSVTHRRTKTVSKQIESDGFQAFEIQLSASLWEKTYTETWREDNGCVYYRNSDDYLPAVKRWTRMMDIYLEKGDSIHDSYILLPVSRGTITLMGKTRRALKVRCAYDGMLFDKRPPFLEYEYDYIVEGIGMIYGHEPDRDFPKPTMVYGPNYLRLIECWDGDTKIYDHREFKASLYKETERF